MRNTTCRGRSANRPGRRGILAKTVGEGKNARSRCSVSSIQLWIGGLPQVCKLEGRPALFDGFNDPADPAAQVGVLKQGLLQRHIVEEVERDQVRDVRCAQRAGKQLAK